MAQPTEKDQANLFTRWLKSSRRYSRDPPIYTNKELLALATVFLDSTCWTSLPDELVSYTRKAWVEKAVATKAKKRARREKKAARAAKEAEKKRQLELQL